MNSAMWLANFAMPTEIANCLPTDCQFRNGCQLVANSLPISQWLPTGCQLIAKISALLFFQNMLQNLHKTSKINARKIA